MTGWRSTYEHGRLRRASASRQRRAPWSEEEFVAALRAQGTRYHDQHPFHVRMNAGELSREELQRWVANRYYYQRSIPIKDAAILSNCPEVEIRREWISRILDHDGAEGESSGGIESWLRLGESLGVDRETIRERTARAARRPLLGRRLRQLLPPGTVGLRGRLLADRAVRAGRDQGPARGARRALPVDRPGRARVLPLAADAGAARRRSTRST